MTQPHDPRSRSTCHLCRCIASSPSPPVPARTRRSAQDNDPRVCPAAGSHACMHAWSGWLPASECIPQVTRKQNTRLLPHKTWIVTIRDELFCSRVPLALLHAPWGSSHTHCRDCRAPGSPSPVSSGAGASTTNRGVAHPHITTERPPTAWPPPRTATYISGSAPRGRSPTRRPPRPAVRPRWR